MGGSRKIGLFFISFVRYTLSEHDFGACKHNIKKVLKAFANTNILEWSNIEPFANFKNCYLKSADFKNVMCLLVFGYGCLLPDTIHFRPEHPEYESFPA